MFLVREIYVGIDGVSITRLNLITFDRDEAFSRASNLRKILNSHWRVEVCNVNVASVECVVEK